MFLNADVLITGAGPVGLLTAIELAQRDISIMIIDKFPEQDIKTKAIGINKHTLSILPTSVVKQIRENARVPKGLRVTEVVGTETKVIMNIEGTDTPGASGSGKYEYPMVSDQEQWKTERMLETYLKEEFGVSVQRGVTLKDFKTAIAKNVGDGDAEYVECQLDTATDNTEVYRFNFLIGCDGGGSIVRKKLGFEFKGAVARESFVSLHATFENGTCRAKYGDVYFGKNYSKDDPNYDSLTAGMCVCLPLGEDELLINLDLDSEQQKEYLSSEKDWHGLFKLKELTAGDVLKMFRSRSGSPKMTMKKVKWIAHYRVNSRLAEHFCDNDTLRVFLAGDACHCHSPVGGQGMNMGLMDAKNLGWKIAMVLRHDSRGPNPPLVKPHARRSPSLVMSSASKTLLRSYEEERRAVDAKITKAVEAGTAAFSHRNPLVFFLRGRPQRVIGATLSMIPQAAKGARPWSYDSSILREHWERPSAYHVWKNLISRGPYRVYRRRQNLFRWSSAVGGRISAGDAVPPVSIDVPRGSDGARGIADGATHVNDGGGDNAETTKMNLFDAIRSGPGWTLLIFEGLPSANEDAALNGLPVWTIERLRQIGDELLDLRIGDAMGGKDGRDGTSGSRAAKQKGIIDKAILFPSSDAEAHEAFSILGQSLFLVRPDTYVGLRSEPVRKGAVTRYLTDILGKEVRCERDVSNPSKGDYCPPGTKSFDPLPATMFLALVSGLLAVYFGKET